MYYVNPDIKELYRVKFHDERRNVLRLDMNENPEGLSYDFVEEVKKKITPEFLATYPEKDKVVSLLAKCNGINKKIKGKREACIVASPKRIYRIR